MCVKHPKKPESYMLIKRVIGVEGDIVKTLGYKKSFVKIPKGHCWVEGDNHSHSLDSNHFGPIPLGLVIAKASHIIWPPSQFSKLTNNILPERKVF